MIPLIEFDNADLGYGRRDRVLSGVDLRVNQGEFLGIVGPNGSGKTTLLRTLLGLVAPLSGAVRLRPGLRFGYVPQRETVDTLFPLTVEDVVLMGRYRRIGVGRRPSGSDRALAAGYVEGVGLGPLSTRLYRDLSGGQKQRTLIARALAAEPDVLILDEPTNGMDLAAEHGLLDLFRSLHASRGLTIVVVSHLLASVANAAGRIAIIAGGRLEAGTREEMLSPERLGRLYGLDVRVHQLDGSFAIVTGPP